MRSSSRSAAAATPASCAKARRAPRSAPSSTCPQALAPWLADAGFDADTGDAGRLLLRRTIDAQGKSRAWINGSGATIAQLREAAELLVDIHGQHAWQGLTRAPAVRALLDGYAQLDTAPLAAHWSALARGRAGARAARAQAGRPRARARAARLADRRGRQARARRRRMGRARRRAHPARAWPVADRRCAPRARRDLRGRDRRRRARRPRRRRAATRGRRSTRGSRARSRRCRVRRRSSRTRRTRSPATSIAPSSTPQRLRELDERLSAWLTLARRHRRPPAELPALLAQWQAELAALDAAADLDALERASDAARAAYDAEARRISAARRAAAPKFAAAVTKTMQQLGHGRRPLRQSSSSRPMRRSRSVSNRPSFSSPGHAGTTPRPLAKVASGGELSRIALAVAVVGSELQGAHGAPATLIFDEVDAGIGGAVAETVGRLMKQLGRRPPGARGHPSAAGRGVRRPPLRRQQDSRAKRTTTSAVAPVAGEARVAEIARMLGGEKLSSTSLAHAQEMLASGAELRARRRGRVRGEHRARFEATPTGSAPRLSEGAEREATRHGADGCAAPRQAAAHREIVSGHRDLRLRQIRGPARAGRRRLLLRRQPAARVAARLPAPRDRARRPAHRDRRRRAQRRLAAAPAAAARAAAGRRRSACSRSSSTRRPSRWCGAFPRRGAPTRSPIAARWSRRSSSSASCSPSCASCRP